MNKFLAGFAVGSTLGVLMLCCPQTRHFFDKIETKIKKKMSKAKEKAEE